MLTIEILLKQKMTTNWEHNFERLMTRIKNNGAATLRKIDENSKGIVQTKAFRDHFMQQMVNR